MCYEAWLLLKVLDFGNIAFARPKSEIKLYKIGAILPQQQQSGKPKQNAGGQTNYNVRVERGGGCLSHTNHVVSEGSNNVIACCLMTPRLDAVSVHVPSKSFDV